MTKENADHPTMSAFALNLGNVRVRPDNIVGSWRPPMVWTAFSRTWSTWLPVTAFLIQHANGWVLFDTGQNIASLHDDDYYPDGFIGWAFHRQADFRVTEEQTLQAQLAAHGLGTDDINRVIVSHLHQDHGGGIRDLGTIPVYAHRAELDIFNGDNAAMHGMLTQQIRGPQTHFVPINFTADSDPWIRPFQESYDLFGDQTMVALSTPGHTHGSLSLLIRMPDRVPLLLIGDVAYNLDAMRSGRVPGTGARRQQEHSTAVINELWAHHPELVVLPSHDPDAPRRLAEAWN